MNNKTKVLLYTILVIISLTIWIFIWKDFNQNSQLNNLNDNQVNISQTEENQDWNTIDEKAIIYQTIQNTADAWDLQKALNMVNIETLSWYTMTDYDLLMWVYIDLWDYDKVIEYWDLAYDFLDSDENIASWSLAESDNHIIDSYLIQAYLYLWDLTNAKKYLDKYIDDALDLISEKTFYKYKSWDYKGVIDFKDIMEKTKDSEIGFSLDFLAKSYIKLWEIDKAINTYENLYSVANRQEEEISKIYYWYLSSLKLKDLYLKNNNKAKSEKYEKEYLKFKNIIDDWKIINTKTAYFVLDRQNDL
jgi:hypothetical protein